MDFYTFRQLLKRVKDVDAREAELLKAQTETLTD